MNDLEKNEAVPSPNKKDISLDNGDLTRSESAIQIGDTHLVNDLVIAGLDPTFEAKADLVNYALQEIGMGRYQWWLFVVTGFGWLVDQV